MFQKISGIKIVRKKRGGGFHDFPSKLFCVTVPKVLAEEPFCASGSLCLGKENRVFL